MTTQEFLYKAFSGETKKDRASQWAAVYVTHGLDGQVTAYSYGYHYPLATIINGVGFVNDKGYSNSTAKHINWARSAVGDIVSYKNVYGVFLTNGDGLTPVGIINSCNNRVKELKKIMATKKRHDTQVYSNLEYELNKAVATKHAASKLKNKQARHNTPEDEELNIQKNVGAVMALGDIFGETQSESNDWKARMLKAGLEDRGLIMPEDWDKLDEETKTKRLDAVIALLTQP